jgi:hypothetical protein
MIPVILYNITKLLFIMGDFTVNINYNTQFNDVI